MTSMLPSMTNRDDIGSDSFSRSYHIFDVSPIALEGTLPLHNLKGT